MLRNRPEEALRTLAGFRERHESRLSAPERIRLQLISLSITLRNDHISNGSGEQLQTLLDSLEQLSLASERLDYATEHYVLFAAVLAARHGLADSARAMLDLRRAKSAPSTPYSAALEEAVRVELGDLPPSPSAISNSRTIQLAYSHLRLLKKTGSGDDEKLAGALCQRKPQALAEWGSGFTLLIDNLAAVEEACHHSTRSTVASK
jgi:phage tail protein X